MIERTSGVPIHPGEILVQDYLRPYGIGIAVLATRLCELSDDVRRVAHGTAPITARLAIKLGHYFGTSPEFWMNLQVAYDLEVAREARLDALRSIVPHSAIEKD